MWWHGLPLAATCVRLADKWKSSIPHSVNFTEKLPTNFTRLHTTWQHLVLGLFTFTSWWKYAKTFPILINKFLLALQGALDAMVRYWFKFPRNFLGGGGVLTTKFHKFSFFHLPLVFWGTIFLCESLFQIPNRSFRCFWNTASSS